jgi:hypothetical protein
MGEAELIDMKSRHSCWTLFIQLGLVAMLGLAQGIAAGQQVSTINYDEAKVAAAPLLDPLVMSNGTPVRTANQWFAMRRPEILHLLEEKVYGRTPPNANIALHYKVMESDGRALNGRAIRRQVDIYFSPRRASGPTMHLLLYLPANATGPVPLILGLNFDGNQSVLNDPAIRLNPVWVQLSDDKSALPTPRLPAESTRGTESQRWQVEKILARGYGLATAYYGDIEPDFGNAVQFGVRPLFYAKGQQSPAPGDWGAIGAWAWGLSRALDYIQQAETKVDAHRVVVTGHSRLGKTADWAAAQDLRFVAVLSNESGKGGASLFRRVFGENIEHLNASFPHWFCGNFAQWVGRDAEVPFDGNLLLSSLAPRPLYVATAHEDQWGDPRGEFLSAVSASRVYELLGKQGLGTTEMPPVNVHIGHTVAYHIRSGKHDVTEYDWDQYLDFLDTQLH